MLTRENVQDAVEDLKEGAVVRRDKDSARSVMAAASMIIAGAGIAPEVVDALTSIEPIVDEAMSIEPKE
jgi:hypothetical protein